MDIVLKGNIDRTDTGAIVKCMSGTFKERLFAVIGGVTMQRPPARPGIPKTSGEFGALITPRPAPDPRSGRLRANCPVAAPGAAA